MWVLPVRRLLLTIANAMLQVRKAQRDVDLARESIEDDRKRLQAKDSRLSELATETHEKHQAICQ